MLGKSRSAAFLFATLAICFSVNAQTGNSEVFVFELKNVNGKTSVSNPVNISASPGYDNQPSFGIDGDTVLFTSIRNGRSPDIYEYSLLDQTLTQLTDSTESEYTPRARGLNVFVTDRVLPSTPHNIPGTLKFSFLHRQGNDEVWIKEFDPGNMAIRPIVLTKDSKVDYCWLADGSILMGSGTMLYRFDQKSDKDWVLYADLSGFGLKEITRLAASKDGRMIAVVSNQ